MWWIWGSKIVKQQLQLYSNKTQNPIIEWISRRSLLFYHVVNQAKQFYVMIYSFLQVSKFQVRQNVTDENRHQVKLSSSLEFHVLTGIYLVSWTIPSFHEGYKQAILHRSIKFGKWCESIYRTDVEYSTREIKTKTYHAQHASCVLNSKKSQPVRSPKN